MKKILTNLDWLNSGQTFPPVSEKSRLEKYRLNEKLFLTEHSETLSGMFSALSRRIRMSRSPLALTSPDGFDLNTVINYQQLLSKKTADFICGEPPVLETEQNADRLKRLLDGDSWNNRLYEAFIDISRYGNAVLKFVGRGITAVPPQHWFPIVDPHDLKAVSRHVIAYPLGNELYAEIHSKGAAETRVYAFKPCRSGGCGEIGALLSASCAETGLDDFAVQTLTNVTHSGSIYGIDDYSSINSIVAKIIWRLSCIDSILDKHSEPSISGPASALSWNEQFKSYYLDLGNYFKRSSNDDPDLKYITWDGNLDSAYKEIELLLNQLYIISEMGQAFMEGKANGQFNSGVAIKLRLISPRIKASRLISLNEGAVKRLICTFAFLNSVPLSGESLTIRWNDGIPNDEAEQFKSLIAATGNKPIMSQYSALRRLGLSDAETQAELNILQNKGDDFLV